LSDFRDNDKFWRVNFVGCVYFFVINRHFNVIWNESCLRQFNSKYIFKRCENEWIFLL
jgi:hypothetical protein